MNSIKFILQTNDFLQQCKFSTVWNVSSIYFALVYSFGSELTVCFMSLVQLKICGHISIDRIQLRLVNWATEHSSYLPQYVFEQCFQIDHSTMKLAWESFSAEWRWALAVNRDAYDFSMANQFLIG